MTDVSLQLPEGEALYLFRYLHRSQEGQETCFETYRQLQKHFFKSLTVEEITELLGPEP